MLPVALLAAGCDRQTPAPAQPQSDASADAQALSEGFSGTLDISKRGAAMPDFSFLDPAGRRLSSEDLKGKPALINLWATWCGPCVHEMPMLDSLAEKYRDKLAVITVAQDGAQQEKVATFFHQQQFGHLQPWLDPDMQLSDHYNTGVLPTTVLYDKDGKEVWRMVGAHDWNSARTAAMLADTLAP